jgi:hypothetical protein
MISPSSDNTVRKDSWGDGHYMANRGVRKHKGVDFVCAPGSQAVAPVSGIITREVQCYPDDDEYSGFVIQGDSIALKVLYVKLRPGLVGKNVICGNTIGTCQDISKRYGEKMIPHVHVEVENMNVDILVNKL